MVKALMTMSPAKHYIFGERFDGKHYIVVSGLFESWPQNYLYRFHERVHADWETWRMFYEAFFFHNVTSVCQLATSFSELP